MPPGGRRVPWVRPRHGASSARLGYHGGTVARSSVQFPDPPSRSQPLPSPTNGAMYHTYRSDLSQVRALVLQHAREAGLTEGRANDLVLAVSEVAANTLRHTRSPGTLAIWHDADELVCEIRDSGVITDPLAGQRK